jgi:hypothetical protein
MSTDATDNVAHLVRIVEADKARFACTITSEVLKRGGLLDLPHQSVLRFARLGVRKHGDAIVREYHSNPTFRVELRDLVRDQVGVALLHGLSNASVRAGEGLKDQGDLRHAFDVVARRINEPDWQVISTPNAFALLRSATVFHRANVRFNIIEDDTIASTGALMFYGFSYQAKCVSYLMMPSLRLLAWTLQSYAVNGPPPECGDAVRERLIAVEAQRALRFANTIQCEAAVIEMIVMHEIGHHTYATPDSYIVSVLRSCGVSDDDYYLGGMPTETDLGAWQRVCAGSQSVRDVHFLLGDFLANLTALSMGCSRTTLGLLRAFHWWLLWRPKANRRSRGVSWLLGLTENGVCWELAQDVLESVFVTAVRRPNAVHAVMRSWDDYFWRRIARTYGIDDEGF